MKRLTGLVLLVFFGMLATSTIPAQTVAPMVPGSAGPASPAGGKVASFRGRLGLVPETPYVRGKIPVVLIHGLWMNMTAWDKVVAALRADPAIDDRFRFWRFGYSTGDPIPVASALFRRELDQARRKDDLDRSDAAFDRMVLVGHSMGGLLAKMMVVDSGDHLWRVISARGVEELRGERGDLDFVSHAAFATPRPDVRRVVFIATPHRGSRVDSGSIHLLGNRLARISDEPSRVHRRLIDRNEPGFFHEYFAKGLPTSVEELQANGPFLETLFELPIAPDVRAHSIIAIRPDSPPRAPTDGLVTVDSARIGGVASEKLVTSPHLFCLENAEVIAEVRRILQEHGAGR